MMQSPYDIGFGPWGLWLGMSLVNLLILAILAWSVVSFLRHRDSHRDRPGGPLSGGHAEGPVKAPWVAPRGRHQSRRRHVSAMNSPISRRSTQGQKLDQWRHALHPRHTLGPQPGAGAAVPAQIAGTI